MDVGTPPMDVGTPPTDVGTPPTDVRVVMDAAPAAPFTVRVSAGASAVAAGSSLMPMQLNGIKPYSFGVTDFTIANGTGATTITSVTVEPIAPTIAEEWNINTSGSTVRMPLVIMNRMLAPAASLSFGVYFAPRASGQRDVRIRIAYTGGEFAFTLQARARDNLVFSPNLTTALERTYGLRTQSSNIGTAVADAAGNLYFSQNVTQWGDNFSNNIAIARMNADGSLGWQREWNERFLQAQPDSGQNNETGGTGNSMSMGPDGSLFFCGNRSQDSTNNTFQGLVTRLDPATGNILWSRGILRSAAPLPLLANQGVEAYAVDATLADRVIVAGSANNGGVLLAALSKTDGTLLWSRQVSLTTNGTNSRAHALAVDAMGNGYFGGFTGDDSTAVLARVTGLNGVAPTVAWSRTLAVGRGGNINHLVLDGAGGVVASIDYRGATTYLGLARVSATGTLVWGRVYDHMEVRSPNSSSVIAVSGTSVYLGGRMGLSPFDTSSGDGAILRLALADGSWQWGAFYYTGTTTSTFVAHRIKAIIPTATGLLTLMQSFPGMNNSDHYTGYWYQTTDEDAVTLPSGNGSMRLANSTMVDLLRVTERPAVTLQPLLFVQSATQMHPGTAHVIDTSMIWVAPPAAVTFVPPTERRDNNGRTHAMIQRLTIR